MIVFLLARNPMSKCTVPVSVRSSCTSHDKCRPSSCISLGCVRILSRVGYLKTLESSQRKGRTLDVILAIMADQTFDPDMYTKMLQLTPTYHRDVYPALNSQSNASGKSILITGASKGIGKHLALVRLSLAANARTAQLLTCAIRIGPKRARLHFS
jgi:hypothetical protein